MVELAAALTGGVFYVATSAFVWRRIHLTPRQCGVWHSTSYPRLHACGRHVLGVQGWDISCLACCTRSQFHCFACAMDKVKAAIWPVLTPVWLGMALARREDPTETEEERQRRERYIKTMEREVFGG